MKRDPTRSAGLRRQGRANVTKRVHVLQLGLKDAFADQDVAGLRKSENLATRTAFINWVESVAHKMARAEEAIEVLINGALVSNWPDRLIERAVELGIEQVEQELRTSLAHLDASEVSRLHAIAASSEVRGIAGETERRLLRHVVRALEAKAAPEALMRDMRETLQKITRLRLHLMINTMIVRAVNAGKLFGYEAEGIEKVGIDPSGGHTALLVNTIAWLAIINMVVWLFH